jgi:indole-3-glycerol phosphate synthase
MGCFPLQVPFSIPFRKGGRGDFSKWAFGLFNKARNAMHSRLIEILTEKRKEVQRLKREGPGAGFGGQIPAPRDFTRAISVADRVSLIAEVKFASPSAGVIRKKTDPLSIARTYEKAGAAAISLLTDRRFFGGDLRQLPRVKQGITLPVLRKDFIIDGLQIRESSLYGADALLLIARILSLDQLEEFLHASQELGMAVLTEVHDTDDLDKALDCDANIIGINNRDLDTFEVNLDTTFSLVRHIPKRCIVVSESGIREGKVMGLLKKQGIHAALAGTALMEGIDPGRKAWELVQAGSQGDDEG